MNKISKSRDVYKENLLQPNKKESSSRFLHWVRSLKLIDQIRPNEFDSKNKSSKICEFAGKQIYLTPEDLDERNKEREDLLICVLECHSSLKLTCENEERLMRLVAQKVKNVQNFQSNRRKMGKNQVQQNKDQVFNYLSNQFEISRENTNFRKFERLITDLKKTSKYFALVGFLCFNEEIQREIHRIKLNFSKNPIFAMEKTKVECNKFSAETFKVDQEITQIKNDVRQIDDAISQEKRKLSILKAARDKKTFHYESIKLENKEYERQFEKLKTNILKMRQKIQLIED